MLRPTLIAVALSAAGGAAWLALAVSPEPQVAAVTVIPEKVAMADILVAAAVVPEGGKVGPEHLKWQAWPEDAVQPGFISRSARPEAITEVEGSVTRNGLVAGEPVLGDKLAPAGSGFLSYLLEPGSRAIAVRVSAENTAGGFVLPNDRVDVLHTTPCEVGNGCTAGTKTRTILRNVKVLAIDQQGGEGSPEAVVVGKTATLELSPAQSELVVGAESSGMLSLALRPAADNGQPQEAVSAPTEEERPELTVRVRRGAAATEVIVVR